MAIPQKINECDNESTERLNCPNNNAADENGIVHTGDNENENQEVAEVCVTKEFYYVLLVVNGILLGVILSLLALNVVRVNNDCKDDPQASISAHPPSEDSFYSCSPCKPMVRTYDADTMRLFMKSSSMLCCKRTSPDFNIEVSKFLRVE